MHRLRRHVARCGGHLGEVINRFGAMQMGTHRFYAIVPGTPDRLTEVSRFIDLWQQPPDGGGKLARVISYDHPLAEPPAR